MSTTDPFRQEKFLRDEEAQWVISAMVGTNMTELRNARKEEHLAKVAELEAIGKEYASVQEAIYSGDENAKTKCIEKFGPIVKKRLNQE